MTIIIIPAPHAQLYRQLLEQMRDKLEAEADPPASLLQAGRRVLADAGYPNDVVEREYLKTLDRIAELLEQRFAEGLRGEVNALFLRELSAYLRETRRHAAPPQADFEALLARLPFPNAGKPEAASGPPALRPEPASNPPLPVPDPEPYTGYLPFPLPGFR